MPPSLWWQVQSQLNDPRPNLNNVAALAPNDRAQLLYEIAWRHSITFEYIAPWLADVLFQVANPENQCNLSKRQQLEIALVLLKNSRLLSSNDEAGKQTIQEHINRLVTILKKHEEYLPSCAAELTYHQALVARDALNYAVMEELVENITGEDPVWKLRKAALLMELGRFKDGKRLITDAYRELQERYRYDQNSIRILSRMAWAHLLLRAATQYQTDKTIRVLPPVVKDWQCDPWTWIENIKEKVGKQQESYLKNQKTIEPLFEQGHYRDNSNQHSFSNETSAFLLLEGLSRDVGIPLRSGSASMKVDLLADTAEKLVLAGGVGVELWDFTMALRAASSESAPSIKGIFTRIGVAMASQLTVDTIVIRILSAIGYWRQKRSHGTADQQDHALSALRVLLEVLARFVVRVSPDKAKEIFRLAISLGQHKDLRHLWLFDVFSDLLTHSLESIPRYEQGELLGDALAFPLQNEVMSSDFPRWPNPVVDYPNSRNSYPGLEKRVDELIGFATPNGAASSAAALLRLLPLCKKEGFLTKAEHDKLAHVLWGNAQTYQGLPNVAGLFPHAFLFLPAQDAEQVRALVCRHLYEHDEAILKDTQKELRSFPSPEINRAVMIYAGIANAAADGTTSLLPTPTQASALFDRLIVWRPWKNSDDTFGFESGERKRLLDAIGNALSYAIAPALFNDTKTVERFEQLKQFHEEVEASISAMPALVYFVTINEGIADFVEKIIRKSLQNRDAREVGYAAIALHKWIELSEVSSPQL